MNGLVERFGEAQKMMRQMRSGMGMPGMPGAGGSKKAKGRSAQPQVRGKKSRSGNPAKRAQEQAAAEIAAASGLAGFDPASFDPAALSTLGELPPAFKNLLK